MIERIIYQAIEDGAQWFAADTARLNTIFQPEGSTLRVDAAEMAKIRAMWADLVANNRYLRHGYATEPSMVPCYALVLNDDEPKQEYLANLAETAYSTGVSPNQTQASIGLVEDRIYSIVTYGVGVEQCLYMYKILKNIILSQFTRLQTQWLITPRISGRDLDPINMELAKLVYLRVLQLRVGVEEYYTQILTDTPILIRSVDIHRDQLDGNGGILGVEELTP